MVSIFHAETFNEARSKKNNVLLTG